MTDTSSQNTIHEGCTPNITREEWYYVLHALWDLLDMVRKRKPSEVTPNEALVYQNLRSLLLSASGKYPLLEDINRLLPSTIKDMPHDNFTLLYSSQILPAMLGSAIMDQEPYCEKWGIICLAAYLPQRQQEVERLRACQPLFEAQCAEVIEHKREELRKDTAGGIEKLDEEMQKIEAWRDTWRKDISEGIEKLDAEIQEFSDQCSSHCTASVGVPIWEEAALVQANPNDPILKLYDPTRYEISALIAQVRAMREAAGMPPTRSRSGPDGVLASPEAAEGGIVKNTHTTESIEALIAAIVELAGAGNEKGLSYAQIAMSLSDNFPGIDARNIVYAVNVMRKVKNMPWRTKYERKEKVQKVRKVQKP